MWCRVIEKVISEINEEEIENKCIHPTMSNCSLCFYCTGIGGTKLTNVEKEKVNKLLVNRQK